MSEPGGGEENEILDAKMFECECCERATCTRKSSGIGYVCEPCLAHYEDDSIQAKFLTKAVVASVAEIF